MAKPTVRHAYTTGYRAFSLVSGGGCEIAEFNFNDAQQLHDELGLALDAHRAWLEEE